MPWIEFKVRWTLLDILTVSNIILSSVPSRVYTDVNPKDFQW